MATQNKGRGPQQRTAVLSPKAPRIMVTEGQRSVEWQVEAAGGLAVPASWDAATAVRDLASCDGLLITGGGDVNPDLYGDVRHPQVYGLTASRDMRELALLGAARQLGVPVLGICRGLQVINVEAGGTLWQHIPDKIGNDSHGYSMMPVIAVRGSLVARTLGERPVMLHLHHQAVRQIAKGFQVTARHTDGTVEAIESFDGRVVGVQFHPESMIGKPTGQHRGYRLFEAFVSTCTRYRRRARDKGRATITDPAAYVRAWPTAIRALDDAMWKRAAATLASVKPVTTDPKARRG